MKRQQDFKEMTRESCPVCGHRGRCKTNRARNRFLCFRESSECVNGFRKIKQTGECSTYVSMAALGERRESARLNGKWNGKAAGFVAALPADRLKSLSEQLHVAPDALKRIGLGWSQDLHCYTFPERDAQSHVIGITTRHPNDGAKRAMKGSRRGLILPTDFDKTLPLLIVEGASDVAAALTVDLQALGRPSATGGVTHLCELLTEWHGEVIVVGENDQKKDGQWPGRDGAIAVARGLAGRLGRSIRWALPPKGIKDIRVWVEQDVESLSDEDDRKSAGARLLAALRENSEILTDTAGTPETTTGNGNDRGPSQSTLIVELAESAGLEFFRDDDHAYATIPIDEHVETWPIKSRGFRRWLSRRFYVECERVPATQSLQDALAVLEGKALFAGTERKVFARVGHTADAVYLDLCNSSWQYVEVLASNWRVISAADAPVHFRRSRGMHPLPVPEQGGDLSELRHFLNIDVEQTFVMIVSWLLGALQPQGPYPALALYGEQGSAKSCTCRVLRRLIDPNEADLRSQPRDERDLVIAGNNGWVIALDNMSRVPPWLSDALCRIATGGGFATRALYADAEETIFSAQRPIILNGIEELATRPDLLDRAISVTLPTISEHKRRDEKQLWAMFELARPRLLGALLTAASVALRERGRVQLDRMPRMADFATWVVAAEQGGGVPWQSGMFQTAYSGNRELAVESAIESTVIGPALFTWLEGRDTWSGTATDLLAELDGQVDDRSKRAHGWPKTGRGVSSALRRLAPALRARGVNITWDERSARARTIRIERSCLEPSQPSHRHANPSADVENEDPGTQRVTVDDGRVTVDDEPTPGNRHSEIPLLDLENGDRDGCDGDDGVLQVHSGGRASRDTDLGDANEWGEV